MAQMAFSRDLQVTASPEQAWATLTDVPQLASWVAIIEDVVEIGRLEKYTAVLMDRLGPFKLRADLDITVSDVVEGTSLKVHAEGEDRQVGSRILIDAVMEVAAADGGADVRFSGTYEVGGKVASMGSGTINKKAEKIMGDFFKAVVTALGQR